MLITTSRFGKAVQLSPRTIGYQLPISKKVIETPIKNRGKAIAAACATTFETFGGLGFLGAGIAAKDPMLALTGASIFGAIAGQIAMFKGSLWDFAGGIYKNRLAATVAEIKAKFPNLSKEDVDMLAKAKCGVEMLKK